MLASRNLWQRGNILKIKKVLRLFLYTPSPYKKGVPWKSKFLVNYYNENFKIFQLEIPNNHMLWPVAHKEAENGPIKILFKT